MWFKMNLTKLEFDTEARKLLNKNAITYHNKFLVSLFSRCQSLSSKSSLSIDLINQEEPKRKKQKVNTNNNRSKLSKQLIENKQQLIISDHSRLAQNHNFNELNKNNLNLLNGKRKIMFCTNEAILPDYFMSNLRLFVNVWEFGMDGITDDSINLVNLAIRDFIKNILLSILTFKSTFQTCENNKFKYGFGTGTLNPFLINSSTFKMDRLPESNATAINENGDLEPALPFNKDYALQNALVQVACSLNPLLTKSNRQRNQKINLWHLYYSLKNDPTCILAHSIKSTNIERIQMKLFDEQQNF